MFQSTLPVKGATCLNEGEPRVFNKFQSTLPVKGATLSNVVKHPEWKVSIHAPREGSDDFLRSNQKIRNVSIHAPREGSDLRL